MRLVTEDVLDTIDTPDPASNGIDRASEADPEAGLALRAFLVLTRWPHLLTQRGWSAESVCWSRYYWFRRYAVLRTAASGFDAGLEQQALQILENPYPDCEPDWSELERVESLADEHGPSQFRLRPRTDT
jgi:hypothetical protein